MSEYIAEMRHTLSTATLNYDIWWVYKGSETRPIYNDVMNRYVLFFSTSIHAHFVALIVALYRLYENKADTLNVPQLLRKLREGHDLPADVLDSLDALKQEAMPIWEEKIKVLRNRAFGHRSRAHTVEQLFAEANLKPNDLIYFLDVNKKLMNELMPAWDRNTHAFNLRATGDLISLLNDLKSVESG